MYYDEFAVQFYAESHSAHGASFLDARRTGYADWDGLPAPLSLGLLNARSGGRGGEIFEFAFDKGVLKHIRRLQVQAGASINGDRDLAFTGKRGFHGRFVSSRSKEMKRASIGCASLTH